MNKTLELKRASAVMATAKEHHIWEEPIPDDADELIEAAEFVIEQANTAWDKNIRGTAVQAVRFAAEVTGISEGEEIVEKNKGTELEFSISNLSATDAITAIGDVEMQEDQDLLYAWLETENCDKKRKTVLRALTGAIDRLDTALETGDDEELDHALENEPPPMAQGDPQDNYIDPDQIHTGIGQFYGQSGYNEKIGASKWDENFEAEAFAEAKAKKNNLPLPARVEDAAVPELGRNVVDLSIEDLQQRLVDSSLCLAAATWKTAVAQIDEEHAERVANHYFQKAFSKVVDDAKNKDAAVALAESDPKVIEWRDKTEHAHNSFTTHRALKEIYKGYYDTVSRVFAMKQEERERSAYRAK